jgi:hypothetical protein
MNVNEAVALAGRLETILYDNKRWALGRLALEKEIKEFADSLRNYANDLDAAMYNELRADADAYNVRHQ